MAQSLSHALREALSRHAAADRTALVGSFGRVSYRQLAERIDACAASLHARGVTHGELVGINLERGIESIVQFFGAMQAGGCPSVMEPRLAAEAIEARMQAVGMARLIDSAETPEGGSWIDSGLAPSDLAMMQLTSGSTGQPKGVPLTHANLLCNAEGVIAHTRITPADCLLHVMPLHHTNGINNQLIAPFLAGATVAFVEKFRAADIESQVAQYGATYMTGVPTMYARIIPHLRDRSKLKTLRLLRCGSAPITVTLHEQVEAAFGVPLLVSYGLSEATCTSTMNPPGARRIGTVGTVLAGQSVKLFQPGTTEEVAPGSDGEICIAGPALMRGYIGAGAEQPIVEGWLRSGDLGRFDGDGYLAITGRIKDVIIRGGENISPQLVESILAQHPAVKACCVVGGPHADLGEVPVAFVTLRAGERAGDDELKALVGERLPRLYIPAEIRFVDALPENSVGKVDRKALRKAAAIT